MNKKELIDAMVEKSQLSKTAAEKVLNVLMQSIGDALKTDGVVTLVGFGSFDVKRRESRSGRNPSTGAVIEIAATNTPRFKSGNTMKYKVNS